MYTITEYNYFYGATVAHLANNRRTHRKECNAQCISLWAKKIYFENARYFVRLRVELNVLADARDIFSRRKH